MNKFAKIIKSDLAGGVLLALATLLALVVANIPSLYSLYHHFLETSIGFHIGNFVFDKHALHWINDCLMAIFFFLIGLELKRELISGELNELKKVGLPACAALGGMLVPAIIYASMNFNNPETLSGWAIPAATDIAFALGVLTLLGDRVPTSLKVFLASIAIFDDIGAILIIAFFYSHGLDVTALIYAGILLSCLIILNRMNVLKMSWYFILGALLWFAVLKSGIHATIAGVLVAFCIPMYNKNDEDHSPVIVLEHKLHGYIVWLILPLFAFANAGISLQGAKIGDVFNSVNLAIIAGLVIGKPLGVIIFSQLGVKLGIASQPKNISLGHIVGVGFLCGIGFTMSLFIGGLAFTTGGTIDERLGIIIGSILSGIVGYLVLNKVAKKTNHLNLTD